MQGNRIKINRHDEAGIPTIKTRRISLAYMFTFAPFRFYSSPKIMIYIAFLISNEKNTLKLSSISLSLWLAHHRLFPLFS